jgi:anti-anti-sigma factor
MEQTRQVAQPVAVGHLLDVQTVRELLETLRQAHAAGGPVVVDVAGAERVHGAALQVLIALARACQESGQTFRLTGVSASLSEAIRLSGLASLLLPEFRPLDPS